MSRSLTIGIETSTLSGGVAVADEAGELLAHHWSRVDSGYARRLMATIDRTLTDGSAGRDEIAAIAATAGPGSFTGVRVGLTTAKTLAHALGVPLYLFSTLEALARRSPIEGRTICTVLDARRREVYSGVFECGDRGDLVTRREEKVEPCADLLDALGRMNAESIWFTGDGAANEGDRIRAALGSRAKFVAAPWNLPAADSVALMGAAALARDDAGLDPMHAAPRYIRASDAERKLVGKQG